MSAEELSKLFYHDGPTVPTKDIIAEYDRRVKLLEKIKEYCGNLLGSIGFSELDAEYENGKDSTKDAILSIFNEADNDNTK
jgi:hypothetical protein